MSTPFTNGILFGCERSGAGRRAMRALGLNAWSCDLEPADDGSEFHLQCDVLTVLNWGWRVGIFHPPCPRLSLSGARWGTDHWVKRKNKPPRWHDGSKFRAERSEAILFFIACAEAPIPHVCCENPMSMASTLYRKFDQRIHPWQFGHREFKETWLWLRNLPPLESTNILDRPTKGTSEHAAWSKVHRMTPGPERAAARSKSYTGIADAMAQQWGGFAK